MAVVGRPRTRDEFEIAIICALPIESDAVEAIFDEFYEEDGTFSYGKTRGDPNAYTTGRICGHNVVLAYMPGMGNSRSASLAASFRASFIGIRLGLVVGICGGIPFREDLGRELWLGDVIISTGLIQFDFGRQYPTAAVRKDTLLDNLGRPNAEILAFIGKLSGRRSTEQLRGEAGTILANLCLKSNYRSFRYPRRTEDKLYNANYSHQHQDPRFCRVCHPHTSSEQMFCESASKSTCAELGCSDNEVVRIRERSASGMMIHFGLMASGSSVMKSAIHRDGIAKREKVIGFEMEGAGVWETFPTVVIKGICDYADSHKNKQWQSHSAAAAAACLKAFLKQWRPGDQPTSQLVPISAMNTGHSTARTTETPRVDEYQGKNKMRSSDQPVDQGSTKKRSRVKAQWVWDCCNCSNGPHHIQLAPFCTFCQHMRCAFCSISYKK